MFAGRTKSTRTEKHVFDNNTVVLTIMIRECFQKCGLALTSGGSVSLSTHSFMLSYVPLVQGQ